MTDEQFSPQDTIPAKPAATPCTCGDTAKCCSGCSCTKTCASCGHVSRPAAAPVQKDAWSMFAIGALCGVLFGVLLLMIVALDSGHDSREDVCHPRHRNSHECQMYMYHEMMQSSSMHGWGAAENQDMYNHEGNLCDMMGQMSSPAAPAPCVMQSPVMGDSMGGMTGGMTGGAATPQPSVNSGWSSNDPTANSQAQQGAAARYAQEKANFDKFLVDETVKFEASIKGVKDPAEREMRQKDFQAWLRDRQAEFNASHSSKG